MEPFPKQIIPFANQRFNKKKAKSWIWFANGLIGIAKMLKWFANGFICIAKE